MYADTITGSMRKAIDETARRRAKQMAYNQEHGITPTTIKKDIRDILASIYERDYAEIGTKVKTSLGEIRQDELKATIKQLEQKMLAAAEDLAFEQAAEYRDEIKRLKKINLAIEG
ncbi:MAG: UvrABC system protein B [Deltaproteobacteria bacterium ADurb.Bin510]|nr:MAG: UvrABC system protein B [Deltaproteobacteria bacterium ADurb.Bin510]